MNLVNESGESVQLGPQITKPGGEGAIFEVISQPSLAAKIYHTHPDNTKVVKLRHLCKIGNSEVLKISAWPRHLLFPQNDRQKVVGFLMSRIQGKEIHKLYGPRDRLSEFPEAAWDFLIHVARNCAAAFETLHDNGIVMADVNEKNLLVTNNGLVRLIDCDSYQVKNGHSSFYCSVGVPHWTPPELQTHTNKHGFNNLERSFNHDRFGLAVLIFELLFMGRHPFAGIPKGTNTYEIHEAIQRYLFAFNPNIWQKGFRVPPHTLPLAALPDKLTHLFNRAFLPLSEIPNARPTGREWAQELDALHCARKTCSYDPGHKFWNGLNACPWCHIASNGGPNFFFSVSMQLGNSSQSNDVSSYWAIIQSVANGDLMGFSIIPFFNHPATPRSMPFSKPTEPKIALPQAPTPFVLAPAPVLPPPLLPTAPTRFRPSYIPHSPIGKYERNTRAAKLGMILFSTAVLAFLGNAQYTQAIIAGIETCILLLIWAIFNNNAIRERKQRMEYDRRRLELATSQATDEYASKIAAHALLVQNIKDEHNFKIREIFVAHENNQTLYESEYKDKMNSYAAQIRIYDSSWETYTTNKLKWEKECNDRAHQVEKTRQELEDTYERLRNAVSDYKTKVLSAFKSFEATYNGYQRVISNEAAEIKTLELNKKEAQLRQYLDSNLISKSIISGISDGIKLTLVSYGIESALDISSNMKKVPGIGLVRKQNLLKWRQSCEAQFRYNPNMPIPQADIQIIKLKYAHLKQNAIHELRSGAATLSTLETGTKQTVKNLESKVHELESAHAQALANYKICS